MEHPPDSALSTTPASQRRQRGFGQAVGGLGITVSPVGLGVPRLAPGGLSTGVGSL